MINSVSIKNIIKAPLGYLGSVPALKEGTTIDFKPGVNIIVGENGCGKSTLLNLIRIYTLCKENEYSKMANNSMHTLCSWADTFNDGIDVFADYELVVFNMILFDSSTTDDMKMCSFENFAQTFHSMNSSTGEQLLYAIQKLFKIMFSKDTNLKFPIDELNQYIENTTGERAICYQKMLDYYKSHTIKPDEKSRNPITVIMDEPDRNLSVQNLIEIYKILSNPREDIQLIVTLHNPILISKLSKLEYVNVIEMTPNYIQNINNFIEDNWSGIIPYQQPEKNTSGITPRRRR